MKVFRLQEHTPDVYPRKSRDFQLLCNVFDCLNGAVKYDIDSIRYVTDTSLCNDRLLNQLQTKLGFFTNIRMESNAQRIILDGFPYIIKYKGSVTGIKKAIWLFLKSQGVYGEVSINTTNKESIVDEDKYVKLSNTYVVEISTNNRIQNIKVLDEILKYIIPAGYLVNYLFYETYEYNDCIVYDDQIRIIFANNVINRQVRANEDDEKEYNDERLSPYNHRTSIGGVSSARNLSTSYTESTKNDNFVENRYEVVNLWDTEGE